MWIQVHYHVLISQYLPAFLLPSSPFQPEKRPCHLSEYRQDQTQARLNLLPSFVAPHVQRRVISRLALCAKIIPNALGSPPFSFLCCPHSPPKEPSSKSGSHSDRIPYPCCDSAGLRQSGISKSPSLREIEESQGSTEAQLGLSQDSKVLSRSLSGLRH